MIAVQCFDLGVEVYWASLLTEYAISGLVAIAKYIIAKYINDPMRFAYPNFDRDDDACSSSGASSRSSNLIVESIGVDTGFASCNPYFDSSLSM